MKDPFFPSHTLPASLFHLLLSYIITCTRSNFSLHRRSELIYYFAFLYFHSFSLFALSNARVGHAAAALALVVVEDQFWKIAPSVNTASKADKNR